MLLKNLAIYTINFYKYMISPLLPNCCRFTPGCAEYTKLQIEQHGIILGCYKGIIRIMQCNPFSKIEPGSDPD